MESESVSLPLIHEHLMNCCGRLESISDGFYCKSCVFFVHKKCGEFSESIQHPSHPAHALKLKRDLYHTCDLCNRRTVYLYYRRGICDFNMDLYCASYPPPEDILDYKTHGHKLTLVKEDIEFECCPKCGKIGDGFSYICFECDLAFHIDCVWQPSKVLRPAEVNHSDHSLHPLKLLTGQPPDYSDGKCRLCGRTVDVLFYHCCGLNPPPQSLLDLKVHEHQLTLLLPRLDSFTCNACGLKGDRSPYACFHCGFMIHQDCVGLPRVININRHDHRVSRTLVLGVVNSVCRVCRQKVDWTCGGYACQSNMW